MERSTPGPLAHHEEATIAHLLRGFPEAAISSGQALRTGFDPANLENCLFGILCFYLPKGTALPEVQPSSDTRLREDLGLDSLSLAEAMFMIEELFDIHIENGEIAEVITLADARRLLTEKIEPAVACETVA